MKKKLLEMFDSYIKDGSLQYQIINFKTEVDYRNDFSNIMIKLGGKLDVMFLCHGIYSKTDILDSSLKEFDNMININSRSVLAMISLATPFLKYTKGNVVAISSIESFIPSKYSFLNTTSKCIVNSIIKNSALELASFGIRINGVAPGIINTNFMSEKFEESKEKKYKMHMKKKASNNLLSKSNIEPDEVVDVMLFLGCDDAGFMTGEIIKIDSGYSLNHDNCFTEPK